MVTRVERSEEVQGRPAAHLPQAPSQCLPVLAWVGLGGYCFCFWVPAQVLRRKQLEVLPPPSPLSSPELNPIT